MNSKNLKILSISILLISLFVVGTVFAISKLSPQNSGAPASTFHSLTDIYNLINTGATSTLPSSISTTTEPTATTSHSTSEIYVLLYNLVDPANLASGITKLGLTSTSTLSTLTSTHVSSLVPTIASGTPSGFSLEDIWNLIQGTRITTSTHSLTTTDAPDPTMHSTTGIYDALIAIFQPSDIKVGTTYLGVVGTYQPEIALGACTTITESGTYSLSGDIGTAGVDCLLIKANDVIINGNGFTIAGNVNGVGNGIIITDEWGTEYGESGHSFSLNNVIITGSVSANGVNSSMTGGSGGTITITNSTTTSISANGGEGAILSGGGGTITVTDSTTTSISANSGTNSFQAGGGGTITITNSTADGSVSADGIDAWGNGGGGGTINITSSIITGDISTNGGNSSEYGGSGGGITITNSTAGNVSAGGGGGYWGGAGGGTITVTNSTITSISANCNIDSCFGGSITIDNSTTGSVSANAAWSMGSGGYGGTITIRNNSTTGSVSANGGSGIVGGSGGTITVTDSNATSISADGGTGDAGPSGNGGTIIIDNSTITGNISANIVAAYGIGGNGGTITIRNNSTTGNIYANGGSSENWDGTGGNGGTINITSSIAGIISADGGSLINGVGGNGGTINIWTTPTHGTLSVAFGIGNNGNGVVGHIYIDNVKQ